MGQRKYYTQSRYGYARGDEALNYVEGIRRYYQSIIGYERTHSSKFENENLKIIDGLQTISLPQTSLTPATVTLKTNATP